MKLPASQQHQIEGSESESPNTKVKLKRERENSNQSLEPDRKGLTQRIRIPLSSVVEIRWAECGWRRRRLTASFIFTSLWNGCQEEQEKCDKQDNKIGGSLLQAHSITMSPSSFL